MADWQPIETAPKDGTLLLLYLAIDIDRGYASPPEAAQYTIGRWGIAGIGWISVESKEEMWGMGSEYTGPMFECFCLPIKPTHWMPLEPPEPPPEASAPVGSQQAVQTFVEDETWDIARRASAWR